MTKKIFYLFCFVALFASDSYAQGLVITPSDTVSVDTMLGSNQSVVGLTISVNNPSLSDTLHMKWKMVYNTIPHTWLVSFCDPQTCWPESIFTTGATYPLVPGETGLMKLDVTPYCDADSPALQIFTWAPADSANTATFLTFKMGLGSSPNCVTAGITTIETAHISIYPNPVNSELTVSLPQSLDNGQLDIYNLIGSKVYSQPLSATKSFDVSNLETGIYVARISDNGTIISTRKFTKD